MVTDAIFEINTVYLILNFVLRGPLFASVQSCFVEFKDLKKCVWKSPLYNRHGSYLFFIYLSNQAQKQWSHDPTA